MNPLAMNPLAAAGLALAQTAGCWVALECALVMACDLGAMWMDMIAYVVLWVVVLAALLRAAVWSVAGPA